ncbi:MAG: OmpA family protein [Pyrinomonadaceae bacterium]
MAKKVLLSLPITDYLLPISNYLLSVRALSLTQKAYNFFVKSKPEGECAAVNDSDRYPKKLPPDDFSKTTPSIKIPREDLPPPRREDFSNDWEKTNYNYSPKNAPPADEWGKTEHNINIPRSSQPNDDFGKTYAPGRQPKDSDWGATQANINIPRDDREDDFGGGRRQEHNATMPYFQLPEAERAKYQKLPPTAAAQAEAEKNEKKKGGIPSWLWASAGLAAMFVFIAAVLLIVYFFFIKTSGFDVVVKGTQPGSEVFIDGSRWGVSAPDGSVNLPNIKAGQRKIVIKHTGFVDDPHDVTGKDGETQEVTAQQKIEVAPPPVDDSCKGPFKPGEEAKAAQCANQGLDKLGDDFSAQDLLNAMNLYIIKFDVNKFDIKDTDKPFLQKAAGYMKKLAAKAPNVKIQVGGHTDSDGSDAKNQTLSENRAKAVHDALVGFGVNPNMLETQGYGAKVPAAPNDTPEHKFQNRRIAYKAIMN